MKSDMLKAGVTPNVVTWTSIIGACATAGLVEQCFREYDEMLNVGCAPNVYCYNMLIHSCVKVLILVTFLIFPCSSFERSSTSETSLLW